MLEIDQLLDLERQSRRQGSGLGPEDIKGVWRLKRVWKRGQRSVASMNSAVLRGLSASLTITPEGQNNQLSLINSIQLGALELRFEGRGHLQGQRPLLRFQFDRLMLKLGEQKIFARSLPDPKPLQQPFFALISVSRPDDGDGCDGAEGNGMAWLAARGRSGGIALWELAVNQPCSARDSAARNL